MKNNIFFYWVLPAFFFVKSGTAQTVAAVKLNAKERTEIVMNIRRLLADHYVYLDTALHMGKRITQQVSSGAYDGISDPVAFSDQLLKDLHRVYHDGHLLLQYNPALAARLSAPSSTEPVDAGANLQRQRNGNFGFRKVEILPGNIGYLNLQSFSAGRENGFETMKTALGFLANANAIIIDLRSNGGGSQETAALLTGFFLEKRTHLESFYNRYTGETTEYWAEPDNSYPVLKKMPLYVLTSHKSFSCAEMLAYDLQALKRATIVGETTGGGAHGTMERDAGHGFVVYLPYWRGINAVTKTNWELVGVKPDIETSEAEALETAEMKIFENLKAAAKTPREQFDLEWEEALLRAVNHPVMMDAPTLRAYAGVYGERTFTLENGKLFYQRSGRPKFELEAMGPGLMKGKNNVYFKIEFIKNEQGEVNEVNVYYQDNRLETAKRTGNHP